MRVYRFRRAESIATIHTLMRKKSRPKNIIFSWRKMILKKSDFLEFLIFGDFFEIWDFTKDFTKDSLVKSLVKSQISKKSPKIKIFKKTLFFEINFLHEKIIFFGRDFFPINVWMVAIDPARLNRYTRMYYTYMRWVYRKM